jgi:hypothetical protein
MNDNSYPPAPDTPPYVRVLLVVLSSFYLGTYFLCAISILGMQKLKNQISTVINVTIYAASLAIKLLLEIGLYNNPIFFSTKTGSYFNIAE